MAGLSTLCDFHLPLDLLLNLNVILVSWDWHDKAPKTGWLEITTNYSFIVLEVRSSKLSCCLSHTPSVVYRRDSSLASSSFWRVAIHPWGSLAGGSIIPISASVSTRHSPFIFTSSFSVHVRVQISLLYKGTSYVRLGPMLMTLY